MTAIDTARSAILVAGVSILLFVANGVFFALRSKKCRHKRTKFHEEDWPTGGTIEECLGCGMSRLHDECGESKWSDVDIDASRKELEELMSRQRMDIPEGLGCDYCDRPATEVFCHETKEILRLMGETAFIAYCCSDHSVELEASFRDEYMTNQPPQEDSMPVKGEDHV